MPGLTNFPASLDSFTDPTSTSGTNGTAGDGGGAPVLHHIQHGQVNQAIEAIEALIGTAPAGTRPIIQQLISLLSELSSLRSIVNESRINIDALQQQPGWDDSRLFSRDARIDAMASQIAILVSAPAPSGGSTDPLTIHLTAEVFGS